MSLGFSQAPTKGNTYFTNCAQSQSSLKRFELTSQAVQVAETWRQLITFETGQTKALCNNSTCACLPAGLVEREATIGSHTGFLLDDL